MKENIKMTNQQGTYLDNPFLSEYQMNIEYFRVAPKVVTRNGNMNKWYNSQFKKIDLQLTASLSFFQSIPKAPLKREK